MQVEIRPATLSERLETIAEVFDLRAHTIAERYDDIDDWELKMELAQSRAATIREAIAALEGRAPASPLTAKDVADLRNVLGDALTAHNSDQRTSSDRKAD